jgi:hypothetical protein
MVSFESLTEELNTLTVNVLELKKLSIEQLSHKPDSQSWSALQCLAHLNLYAAYYHYELDFSIRNWPLNTKLITPIKYSWLGKKSIETVSPQTPKAQKTLARMNPAMSKDQPEIFELEIFLAYIEELKRLIIKLPSSNYNKKSIRIEFFKWMNMRAGETVIFLVRHMQRHVQQATHAIQAVK